MKMTYSIGIGFLGDFRPAYFEAPTMNAVAKLAIEALAETDRAEQGRNWILHAMSGIRKGYSSVSTEHGAFAVSMREKAHDPFLDTLTASFPAYPGLDYSNCVNV